MDENFKNTEDSILWLLESNISVTNNLIEETKKHEIDPQRLVFAKKIKYSEHLKRFQHMDLFLDTFHIMLTQQVVKLLDVVFRLLQ